MATEIFLKFFIYIIIGHSWSDDQSLVEGRLVVPSVWADRFSFVYSDITYTFLKFQSPLLLTQETGSVHDETSSSGNKEDEDDDEDEGEDKIDPQQYDPERLKAFNVSSTRNFKVGSEMGM